MSAATHANFPFPSPDDPSPAGHRALSSRHQTGPGAPAVIDLPPDVAEFIDRSITTIEQLDILQLLAAEPAEAWTAAEIYRRILTSVPSIEQHLKHFRGLGLVSEGRGTLPSYQLTAEEAPRERIARTLASYREMPVRVIRRIYEQRPSEAQGFADAFIIKRQGQ